MSYQSVARLNAAPLAVSLSIILVFSGCGLTGNKDLADDSESDAEIELTVEEVLEANVVDPNGATEREIPLRENHAVNLRLPTDAALDIPAFPLGHIQPTGAQANLLKPTDTPEPIPAPAQTGELSPIMAAFSSPPFRDQNEKAIPAPPPVVSPASKPSLPRKVVKVDTDTFHEVVLDSDVPVIVDFYTDWCGPCKHLAPKLDQFAREQSGVRVVKVNADHDQKLTQIYRVKSYPTVMVFRDGKVIAQHVGLPKIQKALGL